MQAKHLKQWIVEAEDEDRKDYSKWLLTVNQVQNEFCKGLLPTEILWTMVVVVTKGGVALRGIDLV